MTDRKPIHTKSAPEAIGPYNQAIVAGGFVHCSGQLALDPATGKLVEGGIAEQTRRVFENLKAVLEQAGSSLERVVKCNVFLTDLGNFADMNEVYAGFFGDPRPARATVQVGLPAGALIEVDCIALAS